MVPSSLEHLYQVHIQKQFDQVCQLLEAGSFDGLLIAAGSLLHPFRDDVDYPFKVNPYFKAWLPLLDQPGSYVWLKPGDDKPVLFFNQPRDIWHQVNQLDDEAVQRAFRVHVIAAPRELSAALQKTGAQKMAFIGEAQDSPDLSTEQNPQDLLAALDYRRAYKSDYEVACMVQATEKAVSGHRAAEQCFRQGGSEYDIHMAYLQASGHLEEELPYGNIIALNHHAAVLHYTQKRRQPPAQSHSFLIDAGASVAGYVSDISRTYSAEQCVFSDLIAAMEQLQQSVVERIRPGEAYLDLHRWTHTQLAGVLQQFELIRCSPQQAVEEQLTQAFFPHGLGHLLGLQVHDRGGWMQSLDGTELPPPPEHPYLRLTRPVEVGQVFTIEPGLYFIPALLEPLKHSAKGQWVNWSAVDALMPYGGIRIEDNIYIGPDGVRNLTREAGL
ncbi:Xaa-Pro dipeptidase [Aestuariicella sp. G3-2]|uniref:Xaa-Pro dipeptidase n=1 Tax=Pseudomaricurvus albidus TaxID=2842452 RepID=UPI001C0E7E33|nr:Xaa-Pro dipeptidase [Aestuariicella albida]